MAPSRNSTAFSVAHSGVSPFTVSPATAAANRSPVPEKLPPYFLDETVLKPLLSATTFKTVSSFFMPVTMTVLRVSFKRDDAAFAISSGYDVERNS